MAKRSARGGGAALYAARQSGPVDVIDEKEPEPIEIIDEETGDLIPDDTVEVEEPADEVEDTEEPADEEDAEDTGETDAVATMKRQLDAMQAERDAALKRADDNEQDVVVSQQAILTQALNGAKQRVEQAEAEIAAASEAGDHRGVAKATAKLSKAIQDQDRFELAVDEITAEVDDRKARPKKAAPAAADADPYVASLKPFSEPSRAWLLKHRAKIEGKPDVGEEAQLLAKQAVRKGIEVDSPEFFAHLEKGLGFTNVAPKRKTPPARMQAGAPSGTRAASSKPNEVVLTPAEKQAALNMGMPLAEYARNKLEIIKNGKDSSRPGLRFSADTAHSSRR
jgi:hypothetical protein